MKIVAFATSDVCDANEDRIADGRLQILRPEYLSFGRRSRFAGLAATLKVADDNALVRRALETAGHGRVLVIDNGESKRAAVVGGNLAALATRNGWAGILVHGCVRDTEELNAADIGIRALAVHPQRAAKTGRGETDVAVDLSGVTIRPGDVVYADADGIVVSTEALSS